MKTLKVNTRLIKTVEALSDAELGRLFRGMLEYASSGTEPTLPGAERILWLSMRSDIDAQLESFSRRSSVNRKNITDYYDSIRIETNRNDSIRIVSQSREEDKGEEKEKETPSSPLKPPSIPKKELREGETEEETKRARTKKPFVPPTLEDVKAYVALRNSVVDPVEFWEYFNEGHWVDSEGKPVKAWKQKLLTWEHHQKYRKGNGKTRAAQDLDSTYDMMRRWADE